jgi:hypothetical protein
MSENFVPVSLSITLSLFGETLLIGFFIRIYIKLEASMDWRLTEKVKAAG